MHTRRMFVRLVTSSCVVAVSLALAGCVALGDAARLQDYSPGSGGVLAFDGTSPGQVFAVDDILTCVEGEGAVELIAVELVETTGILTVVSFSTLPANTGDVVTHLDSQFQPPAEAGYPTSGPLIIDARCPSSPGSVDDPGGYAVLGLEVRRGAEPATSRGVRVTYESAGQVRTVVYPLGLVLCDDLYPDRFNGELNPECDTTQIEVG